MPPGAASTLAAAHARIAALRPDAYARTRNALDGAVSGLSPYLTHGFVSLREVLAGVLQHHALPLQHKFVFELGWRAYFRHVWRHRGDAILQSLHPGPLPDAAYGRAVPQDVRCAATGVPVVDQAVRTLYATGTLHNHARLWLASYLVHLRKIHWRTGADWLYGHLLDGDLASNHLSWQWVAGTGSHRPYLFDAANVARFAPPAWHSPGSVLDTERTALERIAFTPEPVPATGAAAPALDEPTLHGQPPDAWQLPPPDARTVAGRDVWLVHPWHLAPLPPGLPHDTLVLGLYLADFHGAWPWSQQRWRWVDTRLAELAPLRWWGDAVALGQALQAARSVRCVDEPHLSRWLARWAPSASAAPDLFPPLERRCDSFSQWWTRVTRGRRDAAELLEAHGAAA